MDCGEHVLDKHRKSGEAENAWRQDKDRDGQIVEYPMCRIGDDPHFLSCL
jgi:hypothetical protein